MLLGNSLNISSHVSIRFFRKTQESDPVVDGSRNKVYCRVITISLEVPCNILPRFFGLAKGVIYVKGLF